LRQKGDAEGSKFRGSEGGQVAGYKLEVAFVHARFL